MSEVIADGEGSGIKAGVDINHRLKVVAKNESLQHVVSQEDEQVYQVIGTATLAATTVVVLHIKNMSANRNMNITYIRHQIIDPAGGTAMPNANNYFGIGLGRIYSSGGSIATPINLFVGSGNTPEVEVYQGAPTLSGIIDEIDRWYTKAEGDMNSFNKEGALIIPPNRTLEFNYIGDQTGGMIYTRISFMMEQIS